MMGRGRDEVLRQTGEICIEEEPRRASKEQLQSMKRLSKQWPKSIQNGLRSHMHMRFARPTFF